MIRITAAALALTFLTAAEPMKVDFGQEKAGTNWKVINDNVMGGVSEGEVQLSDESIVLSGSLSLENYGGFASMRSDFGPRDLSDFSKVRLRVRGSGGTFGFMLETSSQFFRPYYKMEFTPQAGEWQVVEFDLNDFEAVRMGQKTGNTLTADVRKDVIRLGVIKSDKKEGPFQIEIDYIEFL